MRRRSIQRQRECKRNAWTLRPHLLASYHLCRHSGPRRTARRIFRTYLLDCAASEHQRWCMAHRRWQGQEVHLRVALGVSSRYVRRCSCSTRLRAACACPRGLRVAQTAPSAGAGTKIGAERLTDPPRHCQTLRYRRYCIRNRYITHCCRSDCNQYTGDNYSIPGTSTTRDIAIEVRSKAVVLRMLYKSLAALWIFWNPSLSTVETPAAVTEITEFDRIRTR
jgi:hypothetical protein